MVRRFVRQALDGCAVDLDHAVLIAGELATNSVCHAPGPFVVVVRWSETELWVGVSDTSPIGPHLAPAEADRLGGRGMLLVNDLAQEWHVEARADGKTVWARLRSR